jgi:hypothetical protein
LPVLKKADAGTAVVIATGPSLTRAQLNRVAALRSLGKIGVVTFNNVYRDYHGHVDVYTACDPQWWEHYGKHVRGSMNVPRASRYHWDAAVAAEHECTHVPGKWGPGLSLDPNYIHYGHSSGYQAINLAVLSGYTKLLLLGFDMHYPQGGKRHYFEDLSEVSGEYPAALRKNSTFTGLMACYNTIFQQMARTKAFEIYNCTPGSAMPFFGHHDLEEML